MYRKFFPVKEIIRRPPDMDSQTQDYEYRENGELIRVVKLHFFTKEQIDSLKNAGDKNDAELNH